GAAESDPPATSTSGSRVKPLAGCPQTWTGNRGYDRCGNGGKRPFHGEAPSAEVSNPLNMTEPGNNRVTPFTLRIGSRGSQLALWQANHIAALLRTRGHEGAIEIIPTTGDKISDVPLAQVGTKGGLGKGIFTKEIEDALAAGRVDLAVHSLKDLPTELPAGFEIAVVTKREDPRDAFCSLLYSTIEELPQGARVGTSSLRRQAQLKAIRPDLDLLPLRGNVDTRLRKLEHGEYADIL